MSLLASFIAALERTGGERLVLRSGEPPHLLVGETRRDLGTATVSNKALAVLTAQILSPEAQKTFAETNAADEPLAGALSAYPLFVEARRSGTETSITLRRGLPQPAAPVVKPAPAAAVVVPPPAAAVVKPAPAAAVVTPAPAVAVVRPAPAAAVVKPAPAAAVVTPAPAAAVVKPAPAAAVVAPAPPVSLPPAPAVPIVAPAKPAPAAAVVAPAPPVSLPPAPAVPSVAPAKPAPAAAVVAPAPPVSLPPAPAEPVVAAAKPAQTVPKPEEPPEWEPIDLAAASVQVPAVVESKPAPAANEPVAIAIPEPLPTPAALSPAAVPVSLAAVPEPLPVPLPEPAVVPPTAGPRIVAFPPQEPKTAVVDAVPAKTVPAARPDTSALDYWIRQAARRDATALYLRGGQAPVMRIRDQVEQLAGDPLDGSAVEGVAAAFAAKDEAWRSASDGMWVRAYDGVGEVRCQLFTDEVGLGLVVHLSAQHSASILQKSIPRLVRRACEEEDGIVLVSAEAAADVLSMVAAVAQWTANKRAGYLISIEPPNGLGHGITGTFVSARRIDGPPEDVAAAIRRAAQQRPDILVIGLPSGDAAEEAIRAARPGCLIILGVVAPTTPRALESLLSLVNPRVEPQMRRALASGIRCGFSYRALRRVGGGRTIVHDALVATGEVRAGLERWDFGGLDKLQRAGTGGMRSLDAALAGAVDRREISLRQAAMQAVDCREVVRLVRQASRERVRTSRDRPGVLRAVAGTSGTQPL